MYPSVKDSQDYSNRSRREWSRWESSDIDEARRVSELERVNGASGTQCDIDAAKRRSQTENWEVRVNQSNCRVVHVPQRLRLTKLQNTFPAGMEPTGVERHRRSPKGELSGESESIEAQAHVLSPWRVRLEKTQKNVPG